MRAYTLHRPWTWSIVHGKEGFRKEIENRPIRPPACIQGQIFAIHAGKTFDLEAAKKLREIFSVKEDETPAGFLDEGIVGVARCVGWIETHGLRQYTVTRCWPEPMRHVHPELGRQAVFFTGPYAWILEEVRALKEPVRARGMNGPWIVPDYVESNIRRQLA